MICPKCGRPVDEAAVICPGCDFILDTHFLGDGILDEEHALRPGAGGIAPESFNLADAVILGNIGEDNSSFETSDSGLHNVNMHARLYVSGRSQAVMSPDAVPALAKQSSAVKMTPFERHVIRFIDGKRPVEAIRRQAGLDESEVKTALATLADKGIVKVVGRVLADAEPDAETAPGQVKRRERRRMRGTLVGAVVVGGDAADQAIDDAFRTQLLARPPRGVARGGAEADAGDAGDEEGFDGVGQDDVTRSLGTPSAALRPGATPHARNAIARASDGKARPDAARPAAASLVGSLLDVDDFDVDGFDDLADSRVSAQQGPRPPHAFASTSGPRPAAKGFDGVGSGTRSLGSDSSGAAPASDALGDDVWSEPASTPRLPMPVGRQPPPNTHGQDRQELSASLSGLLDAPPRAVGKLPADLAPTVAPGAGRRRRGAASELFGDSSEHGGLPGRASEPEGFDDGDGSDGDGVSDNDDFNAPTANLAAPNLGSTGNVSEVSKVSKPNAIDDDASEELDSAMLVRPVRPVQRLGPLPPAGQPGQRPNDDADGLVVASNASFGPAQGPAHGPAPSSRRSQPSAGPASESGGAHQAPREDLRKKARQLFEQAKQEYAAGRLGAARMNVKLASIYDPRHDEYKATITAWHEKEALANASASGGGSRPEYVLLYERAQEFEDKGDIDGALAVLRRGVAEAPNPAAFHNRLGVLLAMRQQKFDEAAAEIQRAITLEPDNAHYKNNLGKVLTRARSRPREAAR